MAQKRRSPGEGTAPYQQPDGRWRAEVVVDWWLRDDGVWRPKRKRVYGATEKEARTKLRRLLRDVEDGTINLGPAPTFGAWLTYWLDEIAAHKVRASTLAGYRNYLDTWVHGDRVSRVKLEKLTPQHLESIRRRMRDAGRSETTVAQLHRITSRALKVAVQRGLIPSSPADRIDSPTVRNQKYEALTPDQVRSLIAGIIGTDTEALNLVRVVVGPRAGELLGLAWDSVDLDRGLLMIRRSLSRIPWRHGCSGDCGRKRGGNCPDRVGGGVYLTEPKSAAGNRVHAIPTPVVEALRRHAITHPPVPWTDTAGTTVNLVFHQPNGAPLSDAMDRDAWKTALDAAGLPWMRRHDARHTAATGLLGLGIDPRIVMEVMGWSQIAMLSRYQHVLDPMIRDASDKVGAHLFGAPRQLEA